MLFSGKGGGGNGRGCRWIDISAPVRQGMVHWPGDPGVDIERVEDMDKGDGATVSRIVMGAHTGTHVDAPLHFIPKGTSIDRMPVDAVIGTARVIEINDPESIKVEELEGHLILPGERILFKTRNSGLWGRSRFQEDFVYISNDAADYLVGQEIMTVGIDYLSVSGYRKNEAEAHRILLGGNIWIIEGLDLSSVQPGAYQLICLPLKIEGGEAAPARAVLRRTGVM